MPDETIKEAYRPDWSGVDDSLFGDAADFTPATLVENKTPTDRAEQDGQNPADTGADHADVKAAQGQEGSAGTGEQVPSKEPDGPDELKVVISIKGDKAIIGVRQSSSDSHIESIEAQDLPGLAQVIPALVERARARWEESPKHPAYERPAPPAKRRRGRQQGAAQAETADGEAVHQQTPRLF